MGKSFDEYKNETFGFLKPIGPEVVITKTAKKENKNGTKTIYRVKHVYCDCLRCGNKNVLVPVNKLLSGNRISCGCAWKENYSTFGEKHHTGEIKSNPIIIHGDSSKDSEYFKLFITWSSMKQRCYYEKSISYYNYGGRGIRVCDEWLHDYTKFKEWALSVGYVPNAGLMIERKDPNKNYCPENCTFTNRDQQNNNKRSNHPIELYGETLNLSQWGRLFNFETSNVYRDSKKHGISIEEYIDKRINPIPDLIKPIIFIDEDKIYKNGRPDIECY